LLKNSHLSAYRRPAQRDDYAMAPSPIIAGGDYTAGVTI